MLDLNIIAYKDEVVPGVFGAPSFATDSLQVFGYNVTPIVGQQVRRSIDLPYAGQRPSQKTAIYSRHAFSVELSGAGAVAAVPWWAKLLKGCMFGTAVPAAGVDCTMPLISAGDGGAGSILGHKDNAQHRGFSARGNAVLNFTEKGLPSIAFDFLSLIEGGVPAVAAVATGVVLPTYPAPVEVNLANTAIILDGFTLGVRSVSIDMGLTPTYYSTTGGRAIIHDKSEEKDRRGVKGTMVAELPDPATKSYFAAIAAGSQLSFSLTHGLTAGNIIGITSASFVPTDITYSVENNRVFMNMPFEMIPTGAGNNELVLKTR